MAEMTTLPTRPGTVHCALCGARYDPTPDQVLVLTGLGPVRGWRTVAARYATNAGWHHRTDGLLLCTDHVGHGDQPVSSLSH